jgi:uncharacterized protein YjcR
MKPTLNDDNDPTSPPRQRGGQPGNLNALKHGFYSRYFKNTEIDAIQDLPEGDLHQEIAALRVIIRRILQLSADIDDVNTSLRLLSTLSAAAAQLSGLVKVQSLMSQTESEDSFEEALRQAITEWHERKNNPAPVTANRP